MRMMFVLLRSAAYLSIFSYFVANQPDLTGLQWAFSVLVICWNSWDHWKRPNEPILRMRLGSLLENALVVLWALVLGDAAVLFMLVSPLMRACIHLRLRDDIMLFALQAAIVFSLRWRFPDHINLLLILTVTLVSVGAYSLVIGMLFQQRERARRQMALSAFEREQFVKEQERARIAGQIHDLMGQHWTSIVRALDVALATTGEQSHAFIAKAQEAAMHGLQEMRTVVHDWHDGRQTPQEWLVYLQHAIARFQEMTGVRIQLDMEHPDWNQLEQPATAAEILIRSTLEAVTNAVRHGDAKNITVSIRHRGRGIEMTTEDDGSGMDEQSVTKGVGMTSIYRSAEVLRGHVELLGSEGSGMSLRLFIPYRQQGVTGL